MKNRMQDLDFEQTVAFDSVNVPSRSKKIALYINVPPMSKNIIR